MREEEIFSSAKILLVDDNQINLFVLNKIFEQFGVKADCVPNGAVAIKKAQKKDYDMIFMDHLMPELDGIETLARLKEDPDFDTPVVVLTANTGDGLEELYREAGFVEYLVKPAAPDSVKTILLRYLFGDANDIGDEDSKRQKFLDTGFSYIDSLLEAGMTTEEYEELLQIFLEESEVKLADCQSFYESEDLKNYAIIVHGLKNDAAMINEEELSAHAKQHEIESKADNLEFVKSDWDNLKERWQQVINKINNYFE